MERYRVAVVDDHVLFRQGLRKIMESADDLDVIGEAGNGNELRSLLVRLNPQMVILDLSMPNLRGIEAVREVKQRCPETKVLVLTMHKEYLHQALSAGAEGYLLKEDADRELFSAIEAIRQGRTYVSPRFTAELLGRKASPPLRVLSGREEEILKLVAAGKSNREIGEVLSISIRTVESHRANIMAKLRLSSTADMVKYAIREGYA